MPRQDKQNTQLREQFLETAAGLFMEQGYDATTVQQVIDRLGVSKGAFYHYFSSKEDILDAVAERLTEQGMAQTRKLLLNHSIPALTRLIKYLESRRQWRLGRMPLLRAMLQVLHQDENLLLRQKFNRRVLHAVHPLFTALISDGLAEGVFHTPDPSEAALLLLQLGQVYLDTTIPLLLKGQGGGQGLEDFRRRTSFYLDACERLLGLAPGALPRVEESQLKLILQRIKAG